MLDLRRVRTLREVAARGTISAAADALHLTPSAASQQLAALEKEVGRPLLEPDGRTVRLTPAARLVLRRADAIFAELEQLDADFAAAERGAAGPLNVGSSATGIIALVAPAAARVLAERPDLDLHVAAAEAPDGLELLDAHGLDILITVESDETPQGDDPRYFREHLFIDPIDVALPAAHPLAVAAVRERRPLALASLAGEPFVLPPAGWSCEDVVRGACQSAGFTPRPAHRAFDWAACLALVGAGLGVLMLPSMAEVPPPDGVVVLPVQPTAVRHVVLLTRRGTEEHPAVRVLRDTLREVADERARRRGAATLRVA